MRIHPVIYGILVLAVFLGIIEGFQVAGVWSVSGKITASGERVEPSSADVNSIKGWMTLEQVTSTYGVSLEEIITHFELPAGTPATTALKELESETFSVADLRLWLQEQASSGASPLPAISP